MFRTTAALLCVTALSAASLAACAPIERRQGFTIAEGGSPASAVVGTDNKTTIRTKYGTPTAVADFDPNVWYYMSQVTDQYGAFAPKPRSRAIVQINFDPGNDKVATVKTFTVADGKEIAYSKRETATVGKTLNIWEQILGTIGQTLLPQAEATPGTTPGGTPVQPGT